MRHSLPCIALHVKHRRLDVYFKAHTVYAEDYYADYNDAIYY